jgi:flagellar biosynthesis protein FlhG
MLVDQATALRELVMEATEIRARTIAITSGKGGVGKTNVSVNLAIRLSQMGRKVVVLDADLGTANADILCNLTYTSTLAHVVAGRKTLREIIVDGPEGIQLVPGASGLAQMAALGEFERARVVHQMRQLEEEVDFILIDTGAGLSPNVLTFLAGADEQLVVTTPDPPAITDAYAVIKSVCRKIEHPEISLLVNMASNQAEADRTFNRIKAVCDRFLRMEPDSVGFILADPCVTQAVRRRAPFIVDSPRCPAAVGITRLAHQIDDQPYESEGDGLLRRMVSWLNG